MDISKLYNANCYIVSAGGMKNLVGRAAEVTLPEIVTEVEAHKALGMIGTVELPTGLAPMTARIKYAGYYPDAIAQGANPFAAHTLLIQGSLETFGGDGLATEVPVKVALRARFKKTPLGAIVSQASTELEQELSVTYAKLTVGGIDRVEVDVIDNVWTVDGVDIREQYRKNLGL